MSQKLSNYQKYVVEYGKYVSNMQEKHGTAYENLPPLYSESVYKLMYGDMRAIKGGQNTSSYARDIVRMQFGEWKTGSNISKAIFEWQKKYAKELGLTQKAAKERGLIAEKMSDIMYKTKAGQFVTDRFYIEIEKRANQLRDQGMSSYDISKMIGYEFYGSE